MTEIRLGRSRDWRRVTLGERSARRIALGFLVSLAALSCSQKPPESAPVVAPATQPVAEAEDTDDEDRKKAEAGATGDGGSALERATAAPEGKDLTRPVGNSLGSRRLGGGDLSDISNRRPLDQRPIGDGGSLATGNLDERSRGSVASGDISDMRGEDAPDLGDRSLQSDHLRDASREGGSQGDLGERDWQGYPEEQ